VIIQLSALQTAIGDFTGGRFGRRRAGARQGYLSWAFWATTAAGLLLPALCIGQPGIGNIVVTSASSFAAGLPPGGSIGTIFCTGLQIPESVTATSVPLPYMLAGITVKVWGFPAPLFAVASGPGYQQINFQVPYAFAFPGSNPEILVEQNGTQGSVTPTPATSPGDFFRMSGTGYGIFQHGADYSLVTKGSPAKPGEMLVTYLTGVPSSLEFDVPVGQPAPDAVDEVSQINSSGLVDYYNMVVDGLSVINQTDPTRSILFFGLAPGLIGVYQINFAVPPDTHSGDIQIRLQRNSCIPFMGQCTASQAPWKTFQSSAVLLPVQ
jgi:uncharacterized protein (TIGR03437 family)